MQDFFHQQYFGIFLKNRLYTFTLRCGTWKAWTRCLYNISGMFQEFNVCFPLTKITKPSRKTKAHRKPACSKSSATPSSSGCPIENKPVFFSRLAMRYSSTHKSSVGRYMPAIYIIQIYIYIYEDMTYFYIYIHISSFQNRSFPTNGCVHPYGFSIFRFPASVGYIWKGLKNNTQPF